MLNRNVNVNYKTVSVAVTHPDLFLEEKLFWKYAADLLKNTPTEVRFQ